ncbi:hypothetical protein [Limosilactobacillus reuteri]|uniref:hypothetical protein n=1 Tax=Limosilactobacillus reuteri TaxID=1598 RepID=UPI00232F63E7|nr:hypothetical protein [Limosilactobacillus reuteri]
MADRRMINRIVMSQAKFLKMPLSTQGLYAQLMANTDDDGIVQAYSVMRMVGASDDDYKLLVAKGFVVMLNDDLVSYMRDWPKSNLLRRDRKEDSEYQNLLHEILPDEPIRKAKPRADTGKKKGSSNNGRPLDGPWTAEWKGREENRIEYSRVECNKEEDEEHHQFSSPSESINHFTATHQISFSKYQLQQINDFKQQLNDERLVVHAMKEAMSKNNDPKVELPFSYLVKILSRYVQEHVTYESLQAKITNTFRKSSNEQMPEWSKKSQEELCKKADSEVIRKLKERIANRGK